MDERRQLVWKLVQEVATGTHCSKSQETPARFQKHIPVRRSLGVLKGETRTKSRAHDQIGVVEEGGTQKPQLLPLSAVSPRFTANRSL